MNENWGEATFEIQQQLYEGPIFAVFSGRDLASQKNISIRQLKSPYSQEPEFHSALASASKELREVRATNIERTSDLVTSGQGVYLLGDPIRGMALSERIKKLAPFSVPVAVGIAISLCESLAVLHRAGITHGDIGEHHVRVDADGTAILQGAGLWKSYSSSGTAGAAVLPQMAPYLAPEVSQGALPTPASDVYGVGILLYQLLTGEYPYHGEQPLATAMLHNSQATPSARAKNSAVPVALDEMVKKAMSKNRMERYPSATELLSDLRIVQDAIRFGRNLQWPPNNQPAEAPAATKRVEPDVETQQVAPIAVAKKEKVSDVPGWLKWIVVFLFALVAFMIGSWMIVNIKQPKLVTVPELKGLTWSQAEQQLKPLKLKLRVMRRQMSESIPSDTIIDSDPIAASKVKEGDTISVVISAGGRFVEVPDLRGLSVDKARLLLDSLGLSIGAQIDQQRDPDLEKGTIIKQNPEARRRVERKTEVKLTVSSGKDRPRVTTNDQRRFSYTIHIELSDIDRPVLMRVDMTDARGTKTIDEQQRQPGEAVDLTADGYGPQATFTIYYNGEIIAQETKEAEPQEEQQP